MIMRLNVWSSLAILANVFASLNGLSYPINSKVLAIDVYETTLALGTRHYIFFYNHSLPTSQVLQVGKAELFSEVNENEGFLEFTILMQSLVAYCTTESCGICEISQAHSKCRRLSLAFGEHSPTGVTSASITYNNRNLLMRIVDNLDRAAILSYAVEDGSEGDIVVSQYAMDDSSISEQFTTAAGYDAVQNIYFNVSLGAFTRGKCSYFVGSSMKAGQTNKPVAKITRICVMDKTIKLHSLMDITLECRMESRRYLNISSIGPAHYITDNSNDDLWFTVRLSNRITEFCRYSMQTISARFDDDWKSCQKAINKKVTHTQSENSCLQSVSPLRQEPTFGIGPVNAVYAQIRVVGRSNELVFSAFNATTSTFWIFWQGIDPQNIWSDIVRIPTTSAIVKHNMAVFENKLFFINGTSVASIPISCDSFYKTCDSLSKVDWSSSLGCMWCEEDQRAVNANNNTCTRPGWQELSKGIIPSAKRHFAVCFAKEKTPQSAFWQMMPFAKRLGNSSQWKLSGTNLSRLKNIEVFICGKRCLIDHIDDSTLTCDMIDGIVQESSCDVKIQGDLGNYTDFVIKIRKVDKKATTSTFLFQKDTISSTTPFTSRLVKDNISKSYVFTILITALVCATLALSVLIWLKRSRKCTIQYITLFYVNFRRKIANDPAIVLNENEVHNLIDLEYEYITVNEVPPPVDAPYLESRVPSLYPQMFQSIDDHIKIEVSNLRMEMEIGHGQFGRVNRARYSLPDGTTKVVACKMLKAGTPGIAEFFREGLTLFQLNHARVVNLIGIAYDDSPILITDYMPNGDLATFFRNSQIKIKIKQSLQFAEQIAEGMAYLHSKKFLHRDLAARNCMLDSDMNVKIADFGLARECNEDMTYSPNPGRLLPVKWMALENLVNNRANFTFDGDIWAYGVVLWEMMTNCEILPYEDLSMYEMIDFLKQGKRLDRPQGCPMKLYMIMLKCWAEKRELRPNFGSLVSRVKEMIEQNADDIAPYLEVK